MKTTPATALFDTHGVRIPYPGLQHAVAAPSRNFHLDQPVMADRHDFAMRLLRYRQILPDAAWPELNPFWQQAWEKQVGLQGHPALSGLLNGPCLPIIIPAGVVEDHGTYLEQVILPAVEGSYKATFPGRQFINYRKGELAGQVGVVPESNHAMPTTLMKDGPCVGLYFPEALRGWSINACRQQMATLPSDAKVILPDAVIHGLALVGYPDILARDWHTPGLDCAANTWRLPRFGLCFWANDDHLIFNKADDPSLAYDYDTGGLLVV